MNSVLNEYAQLKKVSKYKLKVLTKSLITTGLQKSMTIKNKQLKKFINEKDLQINAEFHQKY